MLLAPASAQNGVIAHGDTTARYEIDWESAVLSIELERMIERGAANAPAAPAATQAKIIRDAHPVLLEVLLRVPLSSAFFVAEYVSGDPRLIRLLNEAMSRAQVVDTRTTPDLERAIVVFQIDLHAAIADAVIERRAARPLERIIGWQPSADYTGVLVYAADDLPVFGTDRTAQIVPVVLPELYFTNESATEAFPLIQTDQVPRETIRGDGPVGYATDEQSPAVLRRVGARPLRLLARGLFGTYPSDPVLAFDDASQMLSSPAIRNLLLEGRVVIILPEE